MSNSHEKLPKLFWIQIVLVIIVGVMFLLAPSAKKHTTEASEVNSNISPEVQSAAANLKPAGKTKVTESSSGGKSKARSGEKVYNGICGTCHNTGIANAPKIDDKTAWEPRIANGLAGLMETATNGKGAMPPNGGDPALTKEELKATILYMTNKVGLDLSSTAEKKNASIEAKNTKEVTAPVAVKNKTKVTESVTSAPSAPKAPTAPTAPVITNVENKVEQNPPPMAIKPTPIESPKEPTAVVAKVIAPVAMEKSEETNSPSNVSSKQLVNLEEGKKIYKNSCFACHDAGIAGAPKLTDSANWAPRIATGSEALYTSALKGKGVMPPKGGNMGLSDTAVKAAVDYMAATAQ